MLGHSLYPDHGSLKQRLAKLRLYTRGLCQEYVLTGLSKGACWWILVLEVGKLMIAVAMELLRGRSPGAQVVVVMGMLGALAVAQALVQPWSLPWLRRCAEVQSAALVAMSLLLCGLVVGGAAQGNTVLGICVMVLLIVLLVTVLLAVRLVGVAGSRGGDAGGAGRFGTTARKGQKGKPV
jgi:hypothetical protein